MHASSMTASQLWTPAARLEAVIGPDPTNWSGASASFSGQDQYDIAGLDHAAQSPRSIAEVPMPEFLAAIDVEAMTKPWIRTSRSALTQKAGGSRYDAAEHAGLSDCTAGGGWQPRASPDEA